MNELKKKNKSYYKTKEEVLLELEKTINNKYLYYKNKKNMTEESLVIEMEVIRKQVLTGFKEQGFNCIYNYCETEKGWIENIEDCCPYCISYSIKTYGSLADKIKFNKENTIGVKLDTERKQIALNNKKSRAKKKNKQIKRKRKFSINKIDKNEFKNMLVLLKNNNISIIRKNKKNIMNGLYLASKEKKYFYYDLKELKDIKFSFYPATEEEEKILLFINKYIESYNKINKKEVKKIDIEYLKNCKKIYI